MVSKNRSWFPWKPCLFDNLWCHWLKLIQVIFKTAGLMDGDLWLVYVHKLEDSNMDFHWLMIELVENGSISVSCLAVKLDEIFLNTFFNTFMDFSQFLFEALMRLHCGTFLVSSLLLCLGPGLTSHSCQEKYLISPIDIKGIEIPFLRFVKIKWYIHA